MAAVATLSIYCLLIMAMSLLGGWIPLLVRLTHKRMELALSFISGVMLGVALLLLLPHAFTARIEAEGLHSGGLAGGDAHDLGHDLLAPVIMCLLAGFLVMFLIERFFCFHHHDAPADGEGSAEASACGHDHAQHDHADHAHEHAGTHALTWTGAAIGLTLHSLIDGVALAASVMAAQAHADGDVSQVGTWFAGFGTFLVILLHKPFDSLTLGTLMAAGRRGGGRGARHLVNLLFALLVPIGAGLFLLGWTAGESQSLILSAALAFAAGTFLCIALSDLLPELQFHQHDRVKLSAALVVGLIVAWGIAAMEQRMHVHEHGEADDVTTETGTSGHEGHGH